MAADQWERQPGEPSKAYHAFAHYRDMGVTRSIDKAYKQHCITCLHLGGEIVARRHSAGWMIWSQRWGWVDRTIAWDAETDRQVRTKVMKAQVDARERHARLAQGTLTALSAPVRATLEALADPAVLQQLAAGAKTGSAGALHMLTMVARVAAAIPAMVSMERLALGMTTESVEIVEPQEITLSQRIMADPEATQMAIALLDKLAGTIVGTQTAKDGQ